MGTSFTLSLWIVVPSFLLGEPLRELALRVWDDLDKRLKRVVYLLSARLIPIRHFEAASSDSL
jgi:hypothetical protein